VDGAIEGDIVSEVVFELADDAGIYKGSGTGVNACFWLYKGSEPKKDDGDVGWLDFGSASCTRNRCRGRRKAQYAPFVGAQTGMAERTYLATGKPNRYDSEIIRSREELGFDRSGSDGHCGYGRLVRVCGRSDRTRREKERLLSSYDCAVERPCC